MTKRDRSTALLYFVLFFALFAIEAHAQPSCWSQTPAGPAWICGGNRPVDPAPLPAPKWGPFIPVFEQGVTVTTSANGRTLTSAVNEEYFATKATADAICQRVQCIAVLSKPVFAAGPYSCSAEYKVLLFSDGLEMNAGQLAKYFKLNPEDKYPKVADYFVNRDLKQAREARAK